MADPVKNACYLIAMGPTKWDLAAALFDRSHGRWIYVTVGIGSHNRTYRINVNSVQHHDKSDESWNIEGKATLKGGTGMVSSTVHIVYQSDTREGTIRFLN